MNLSKSKTFIETGYVAQSSQKDVLDSSRKMLDINEDVNSPSPHDMSFNNSAIESGDEISLAHDPKILKNPQLTTLN